MDSNIEHIAQMLSQRHRNPYVIMKEAVMERLDKSLTTYDDELDKGVSYIQNKSEINVLKKL